MLLLLEYDGERIGGIINPGPNPVPITNATLEPSTWTVVLEGSQCPGCGSARPIALALIPVAMLGQAGRAVKVVIGIGRFAVHVDAVNLDLRPVGMQSAQYINLVTHR